MTKASEKNEDKVVSCFLNRNFGQHNATMAGLNYCNGEFVIIMDDDLQHNPKYILKLVKKLKEGNDLCYCNFIERKHNLWKITVSVINNLINLNWIKLTFFTKKELKVLLSTIFLNCLNYGFKCFPVSN